MKSSLNVQASLHRAVVLEKALGMYAQPVQLDEEMRMEDDCLYAKIVEEVIPMYPNCLYSNVSFF